MKTFECDENKGKIMKPEKTICSKKILSTKIFYFASTIVEQFYNHTQWIFIRSVKTLLFTALGCNLLQNKNIYKTLIYLHGIGMQKY